MQRWQRNLYVIWVAELLAIVGFSIFMPFLPLFVQELGVTEVKRVTMWAGLLSSSAAVSMAVFAPLWGSLADRYGRKLMVERALFGGTLLVGAMGFVRNVQQLFLLRTLQGCITGTVAAATTLVATTTPRERVGSSLGLLQMAIYIGASAGPLLGGVMADAFGYRPTAWVASLLLLAGGLLVLFLVKEDFQPPGQEGEGRQRLWQGMRVVGHSKPLLAAIAAKMGLHLGSRVTDPILPLFVQSLLPASVQVASITGLISGAAAAMGALGAMLIGRESDRLGYRPLMLGCLLGSALLHVPQPFVTTPWQLLLLRALNGLTMGGAVPTASALLARLAPEGHQGAAYGVDNSARSAANGLGPMLGAAVAASMGLWSSFLAAALILSLVALWVAGFIPGKGERLADR